MYNIGADNGNYLLWWGPWIIETYVRHQTYMLNGVIKLG